MSSNFWKSNPCSPSWSDFVSNWIYSHPPKLVNSSILPPLPIIPIAGCLLQKASPNHLSMLSEFLNRYFSNSIHYSCRIPISALQNPLWDIYVVLYNNQIIGSIIRKWVLNVYVDRVKWPKAGVIDYFCVHPSWKKKGIGRWLLTHLHNSTQCPIPPHFIFWEGLQPSYPPLSIGFFVSKISVSQSPLLHKIPLTKQIWELSVGKKSVWSEWNPNANEISVWKPIQSNTLVLVWNTFHSSAYGPIGIVLSGSFQAIQELSNSKSYWGVLLVPQINPFFSEFRKLNWSIDSPYQWIAYNMISSSFSDFPALCL